MVGEAFLSAFVQALRGEIASWEGVHRLVQKKRHFPYCSVFLKGYEFKEGNLVLLWVAEG